MNVSQCLSGCQVVNVGELRASLRDDELQTLISREELRQQHLHSATCCSHLELQVRGGVSHAPFHSSTCLTLCVCVFVV